MAKKNRVCLGALCLAGSLALLAASFPSAAAAKPLKRPITGKLSKPGYTVIALAASGKATSVQAKRGKFKLRPPARRVTLQLRSKDGVYAGPIVIGGKGGRAIVGVKAGARLGRVKVKPRKGYAKPARALPRKWIDPKRWARARKGVPIGAGNFGRVRSRRAHGGAPGDRDLDGIPDAFDIDDNGNLILDNFEHSGAARMSQSSGAPPASQTGDEIGLQSHLIERLDQSANANAGPLSVGQVDAALSRFGELQMGIVPGSSVELDCGGSPNPSPPPPLAGGLVYCSPGGTGSAAFVTPPPNPPFPGPAGGQFDPDGDGFGTLTPPAGVPNAGPTFFLAHGATTAQIGTGDVLTECVPGCREGGSEFPATLQDVFATVPALGSFKDETMSTPQAISYPVPAGAPGTEGNGFPVSPGPGTDILLTFTFWRPQRTPIPGGEQGNWIDIGGLSYAAGPNTAGPQPCPQESYSTAPGQGLTPSPPQYPYPPGFTDSAADRAADPANTLTYTLDVTQCLNAKGIPWNPGEEMQFFFMATNGYDKAFQLVFFRRP